jgi:hypothetical protein
MNSGSNIIINQAILYLKESPISDAILKVKFGEDEHGNLVKGLEVNFLAIAELYNKVGSCSESTVRMLNNHLNEVASFISDDSSDLSFDEFSEELLKKVKRVSINYNLYYKVV